MKHNAYLCGKQLVMAQMNLTPLDDVLDKHFVKWGLLNVMLLKVT